MKELPFEYTIVRSLRRKTAGIAVYPDNRVVVFVAKHVTDERVREIVESKAGWIRKRIAHNLEVREDYNPKEFINGEEFCYHGTPYRLSVESGKPSVAMFEGGSFHVRVPSELTADERRECVKLQLVAWYKTRALEDLRDRVRHYEALMRVKAALIRVKTLKSRWGSCSGRGNLSFNWQIIMTPLNIVDYVVVHELCHLVHLNHSAQFWSLLESILPDYRERRQWLRRNGHLLL